jgi:peptidyl-prolyl cis-trans isomerase A (cyclophilin A)
MRWSIWIASGAAVCLALAGCSASNEAKTEAKKRSSQAPAKREHAPDIYRVNLDTSKGEVSIEVHRDWAPHGADHLYELVQIGFYDGNRFYRMVRNFVVQWGINGDPATTQLWANGYIPDDPVKEHNVKGSVTFAALSRKNSRATQLFINLKDNLTLDRDGFTPVGKVVSGMDVVDRFYDVYGDMAPRGPGPDPVEIMKQGNDYLANQFSRLDYIRKATIADR